MAPAVSVFEKFEICFGDAHILVHTELLDSSLVCFLFPGIATCGCPVHGTLVLTPGSATLLIKSTNELRPHQLSCLWICQLQEKQVYNKLKLENCRSYF